MTRVVFDSNVTISALLFADSVPGLAFIRALDHGTIDDRNCALEWGITCPTIGTALLPFDIGRMR